MYVYVYVCVYVCMYVYACMYVCICMCVCMYVGTAYVFYSYNDQFVFTVLNLAKFGFLIYVHTNMFYSLI